MCLGLMCAAGANVSTASRCILRWMSGWWDIRTMKLNGCLVFDYKMCPSALSAPHLHCLLRLVPVLYNSISLYSFNYVGAIIHTRSPNLDRACIRGACTAPTGRSATQSSALCRWQSVAVSSSDTARRKRFGRVRRNAHTSRAVVCSRSVDCGKKSHSLVFALLDESFSTFTALIAVGLKDETALKVFEGASGLSGVEADQYMFDEKHFKVEITAQVKSASFHV